MDIGVHVCGHICGEAVSQREAPAKAVTLTLGVRKSVFSKEESHNTSLTLSHLAARDPLGLKLPVRP